jgi:hypothetical protein
MHAWGNFAPGPWIKDELRRSHNFQLSISLSVIHKASHTQPELPNAFGISVNAVIVIVN